MEKEGREKDTECWGVAVAKAGRREGSRIKANFCVPLTKRPETGPNTFWELTHPVFPITHFIEKTLELKVVNNLPEVVNLKFLP